VKRVLLLGGTGFIGSYVLNRLRARGDVRTLVLAHRNVDYRSLEDVDLVVDSLTRWDLSWIEIFQPDTIIHVARLGGAGRLGRAWASRRGWRANQRLVDWLVSHAPDTRVVYVSGTLVYGDRGDADVDEASALDPIAFAREYIRAERPWMDAQQSGTLPVTIVRPPWVVGPGSWLEAHYVRPARENGGVPLYGGGDNWMTLLDVEDCAGAIVHLAEQDQLPETVNLLAPDQWTRQRDFAQALARLLGSSVRPVSVPGRRLLRDRAIGEALTFSLRATTRHPSVLDGYVWKAPSWPEMLARHSVLT
jgi:nucleoside-diphosphate-sugar epimerase